MQSKRAKLTTGLGLAAMLFVSPATAMAQPPQPVQEARQVTVGNLIAALNNLSVQVNALNQALNNNTIQNIRLVNVEDVLNENNVQAFNNALNRNEVEILNLRNVLNNSLNNNTVLQNVLNSNNVAVGEVVAVDVLSGSDVILFYQR